MGLKETENYLDITKSVMISSPAGSGKTEKLARRYIALLKAGSEVERILAITFTDKAAAEMKERILSILRDEDPEMFGRVREKMPRMRISTIHSFCLKLLKRFCIELGIDPSLEVMDGFNADILWSEAIYESLLEDGASGERLFYEIMRDRGLKGWNKLYGILREVHGKRPNIELGIRGITEFEILSSEFENNSESNTHLEKIIALYSRCLDRYRRKKFERHLLDYNDLELMAYEAISKNPEWQNILFSFDEHTDHILVDEFQDTSSLQWKIIDKLTEEWRSGLGSKRESGINPTIFLVGDDKQSIYSFRGANVGIFKNARRRLSEWLGAEYHFIEVKENYRSLPAIINFVNALFEKLMPGGLYDDWRIEYTPFEATRQSASGGEGAVELMLLKSSGATRENRKMEASLIARKMKELAGSHVIYDNGERGISKGGQSLKRSCCYGDMAVLLRSRTHLSVFEDALRREDIPFVVVKGIGFYNTPEAALLRDILFFLIDPMDDYRLFNILRSPLFSVGYDAILKIVCDSAQDDSPIGYLYHLLNSPGQHGSSAQGDLWENVQDRLHNAMSSINNWLDKSKETRYAVLLEEILNETGAWQYFHERQRYVNSKKFIRLVEDLETKGLTGLEIREKLIKASTKSEEPKANVNTEGMDAVRIMTIHASKGLQFPMVFIPCLDEEDGTKGSGGIVMDGDGDRMLIAYEGDSEIRKTIPIFQRQKEKIQEEEKRLFYVAATRAMDYLCMSGILKDRPKGKLEYLMNAFDLDTDVQEIKGTLPLKVDVLKGEDLKGSNELQVTSGQSDRATETIVASSKSSLTLDPCYLPLPNSLNEMVFIEPIDKDYRPATTWLDVTEEVEAVRRKHGEDWVILGRAFHRLFEGISKNIISVDDMEKRIIDILKNEAMNDRALSLMKEVIISDMRCLEGSGYLREIIMPKENSYAELPFILQRGKKIYRGRIDRVIIKGDAASIYDYKTYPVSEEEMPELTERYSFQMEIYKEAVEKLFSLKTRAYLFFTHEPRLVMA
ncbi:MAG: hypothetical protein OHK0032_09970 [Thermodesulfovibrionales bacterium]